MGLWIKIWFHQTIGIFYVWSIVEVTASSSPRFLLSKKGLLFWLFCLKRYCCSGVNAVTDVNNALASDDPEAVLRALQNPALQLQNVDPANITHYLRLLNKKRAEKVEQTGDSNSILWIDEIQNCIDTGNLQTKQALKREFLIHHNLI